MNARDDGGQAFPSEFFETEHGDKVAAFAGSPGMTLRDWFAGQALSLFSGRSWDGSGDNLMQVWAASAYALADAMIEERVK